MNNGNKNYYKKGANLRNVVNPFDLVDADGEDVVEDTSSLDNHQIDSEVLIHLRKANKKDLNSRFKGLEGLISAVQDPLYSDTITSKFFAQQFLKLFAKLSVDPERRVRESVFTLLDCIIADPQTRRLLNHVIGELAFYWVGAFFDPFLVVASLAKRCHDVCFNTVDKRSAFVRAVSLSVCKMILETVDFRAAEARLVAENDSDLKESSEMIFSIHIQRALSALAYLKKNSSSCTADLQLVVEKAISLESYPLVKRALIQYLMQVDDPLHANRIMDLCFTDVNTADLALDLFMLDRTSIGDFKRLCDYLRLVIGSHPKQLIAKVKRVAVKFKLFELDDYKVVMFPNSVDMAKLLLVVEELFSLVRSESIRESIIESMFITRQSPWNNVDVGVLLDTVRKVFGDAIISKHFEQFDCTGSVPLLLFKHKGNVDLIEAQLRDLKLTGNNGKFDSKQVSMIMEECGADVRIRDILIDDFARELQKGRLFEYIKYFDIDLLLTNGDSKPVLDAILQHDGDCLRVPWVNVVECAQSNDYERYDDLVVMMVKTCEYGEDLMSFVEDMHDFEKITCVHESWLQSKRFTMWCLVHHVKVDLDPELIITLEPEYQLLYLDLISDLSSFAHHYETLLESMAQRICRSSLIFEKTCYFFLLNMDSRSDVQEHVPVVKRLYEQRALSPPGMIHGWVFLTCHSVVCDLIDHIVQCDMIFTMSESYGGAYSLLFELTCKECDSVPLTRSDHSMAVNRVVFDPSLIDTDDTELLMALVIPSLVRSNQEISPDSVLTRIITQGSVYQRLYCMFLDAVKQDTLLIDTHKPVIKAFIDGLCDQFPCAFLSHHFNLNEDFLTDGVKERVIECICTREKCDDDMLSLTRQFAPYSLDLFTPHLNDWIMLVQHGTSTQVKLTARFIFNLLHDRINDLVRVNSDCLPLMFYQPNTLDGLELLVGFLEVTDTSNDALLSKVLLSDGLVSSLIECLQWDTQPHDLTKVEFSVCDWDDVSQPEYIKAANVLFRAWRVMPSMLRRTRLGEKKDLMARFISPVIIQRELAKCRSLRIPNLTVKQLISSTQTSINAVYSQDEDCRFSLRVDIPPAFPLVELLVQPVDQQENKGIVAGKKMQRALLSAQSILRSSSKITHGLTTWADNMAKQLDGVEPCSVCYCVVHPADKTLPTPACKTCKHRFHSACLYKWFSTSGQATCPMCRSLF